MRVGELELSSQPVAGPLPMSRAVVDEGAWLAAATAIARERGRLIALWASDASATDGWGRRVSAAYAVPEGLLWLELPLDHSGQYPDLVPLFPAANRMQRAATDLAGVVARDARDRRPWLDHGAWPAGGRPLDAKATMRLSDAASVTDYPFVPVTGDGVHEIPVGPVHAGIIEPGHFRFSVVGEKVLRLEERLGYTHKGIERRLTELPPLDAHRLAGRVSGDSTVAYAWAYCMALEGAADCTIPERAAWLRALALERERIANHLGDLGALGNDAGLAFGLAQFSRLREDWLRGSKDAFGHRLMMDALEPGGMARDLDAVKLNRIAQQASTLEADVKRLQAIYEEHAGLQDRLMSTGRVTPELAAQLGLTGLAGRASGQAADLRCDRPFAPYDTLGVRIATRSDGDVGARVAVRFDETIESLRLVRLLCERMPPGAARCDLALPTRPAVGAGWIEGWRGEIFVALELGDRGGQPVIVRCHCHDPSWQNWPVLEHAIIGNIVPDFPLINKSFNLTYSGHDL